MSRKLLLSVEDVSKTYDGFRAINQLNFYLDEGELRTVIGPNGAGKSTFFDLLSGRAKPDTGKVEFDDIDLTKLDECTINQLGIGRKFQAPSVYVQLTVWDNGVGFQADRPRPGGAGLELASTIVREKLTGEWSVESGPGGTRISFDFLEQ